MHHRSTAASPLACSVAVRGEHWRFGYTVSSTVAVCVRNRHSCSTSPVCSAPRTWRRLSQMLQALRFFFAGDNPLQPYASVRSPETTPVYSSGFSSAIRLHLCSVHDLGAVPLCGLSQYSGSKSPTFVLVRILDHVLSYPVVPHRVPLPTRRASLQHCCCQPPKEFSPCACRLLMRRACPRCPSASIILSAPCSYTFYPFERAEALVEHLPRHSSILLVRLDPRRVDSDCHLTTLQPSVLSLFVVRDLKTLRTAIESNIAHFKNAPTSACLSSKAPTRVLRFTS